jgi:hypothetical protein
VYFFLQAVPSGFPDVWTSLGLYLKDVTCESDPGLFVQAYDDGGAINTTLRIKVVKDGGAAHLEAYVGGSLVYQTAPVTLDGDTDEFTMSLKLFPATALDGVTPLSKFGPVTATVWDMVNTYPKSTVIVGVDVSVPTDWLKVRLWSNPGDGRLLGQGKWQSELDLVHSGGLLPGTVVDNAGYLHGLGRALWVHLMGYVKLVGDVVAAFGDYSGSHHVYYAYHYPYFNHPDEIRFRLYAADLSTYVETVVVSAAPEAASLNAFQSTGQAVHLFYLSFGALLHAQSEDGERTFNVTSTGLSGYSEADVIELPVDSRVLAMLHDGIEGHHWFQSIGLWNPATNDYDSWTTPNDTGLVGNGTRGALERHFDGLLVFTYSDTGPRVRVVRCENFKIDGTGTWA